MGMLRCRAGSAHEASDRLTCGSSDSCALRLGCSAGAKDAYAPFACSGSGCPPHPRKRFASKLGVDRAMGSSWRGLCTDRPRKKSRCARALAREPAVTARGVPRTNRRYPSSRLGSGPSTGYLPSANLPPRPAQVLIGTSFNRTVSEISQLYAVPKSVRNQGVRH
jgi:hypothetical protein